MTNVPTLNELTEKGYKIEITHHRNFKIAYSEPITNKLIVRKVQRPIFEMDGDARSFGVIISELLPNGGKTEVKIIHPSGYEFFAHTTCADTENYNNRRGVEIALKRAYQLMLVCDGTDGFSINPTVSSISGINES